MPAERRQQHTQQEERFQSDIMRSSCSELKENMQSQYQNEAAEICLPGCCPTPLFNSSGSQKTLSKPRSSSATCRREFAATTASSLFPNTQFTNHESLPSLQESFIEFKKVYPHYSKTDQVDQIRAKEYYHLSPANHTCLDYIGIGLFSYHQLQYCDHPMKRTASSSNPLPPPSPPRNLEIPFFSISAKSGNLKMQLLHGAQESKLETAMKKRIMAFLNISEDDYSMVFTANRTSAFKLLAESYPFQSARKLLTIYDYESEAVETMTSISEKRGAKIMSAEFSWPRLRIHSEKLRNMIGAKMTNKRKRGLFVFPLHSRVTGARYPYLWMSIAEENGWQILIDACALGPKDMNSFGLSLFRPDFLICSFYKVFGENPSGFGCLFVKKSTISILEASSCAGIVNLVGERELRELLEGSSGIYTEHDQKSISGSRKDDLASEISFSGRMQLHSGKFKEESQFHHPKSTAESKPHETPLVEEPQDQDDIVETINVQGSKKDSSEIECRGLDQVDSLGLIVITDRARYLINWLVNSLMKLKHPNTKGISLVKIYGPKIKFDRGPALAFNLFDWKGEKLEPVLVQKLADRSSISLSFAFLHHIWFSEKYTEDKERVLQTKGSGYQGEQTNKKKNKSNLGVTVVTAALGFLATFEDMYKLWAFVAQFLDADFVEKERWRYTALNQKTVEI